MNTTNKKRKTICFKPDNGKFPDLDTRIDNVSVVNSLKKAEINEGDGSHLDFKVGEHSLSNISKIKIHVCIVAHYKPFETEQSYLPLTIFGDNGFKYTAFPVLEDRTFSNIAYYEIETPQLVSFNKVLDIEIPHIKPTVYAYSVTLGLESDDF